MATIVGADGDLTATGGVGGVFRGWSITASAVVSEVTAFSTTEERQFKTGLLTITGSAFGVPDDASEIGLDAVDNASGSTVTCVGITGHTLALTAIIPSINVASDKTGDATIAFDFMSGGTASFSETWS